MSQQCLAVFIILPQETFSIVVLANSSVSVFGCEFCIFSKFLQCVELSETHGFWTQLKWVTLHTNVM